MRRFSPGSGIETQEPPLYQAVLRSPVEAVRRLLDHKANPNQVAISDGFTPLILAAQNKYEDKVRLLIEYKADVNYQVVRTTRPTLLWAEDPKILTIFLNPDIHIAFNQNLLAHVLNVIQKTRNEKARLTLIEKLVRLAPPNTPWDEIIKLLLTFPKNVDASFLAVMILTKEQYIRQDPSEEAKGSHFVRHVDELSSLRQQFEIKDELTDTLALASPILSIIKSYDDPNSRYQATFFRNEETAQSSSSSSSDSPKLR